MNLLAYAKISLLAVTCILSSVQSLPTSQSFKGVGKNSQWHHGLFENLRAGVQKSAHTLLHYQTETPLHLPLEVVIVLVGWNGDGGYRYKMDSEELFWFLQRSFPTHRPACVETGEELEVEHDLTYTVLHVDASEVVGVEQVVKENMRPAGLRTQADNSTARLYDVEATAVEPALDRLYTQLFNSESGEGEGPNPATNAIFLLNLDKVRMDPHTALSNSTASQEESGEAGYVYRFRYRGGAPTQVWLSHGSYAVVDLSAGPCAYGKVGAGEGFVGPATLPRVRSVALVKAESGRDPSLLTKESHDHFRGRLTAVIVSAIEHLFSPDIRFETLDVAHRVLLPILVLRNHADYDPLQPGHEHSLNITAIVQETTRMLQPGQELVVVKGQHSLHDHPRLAMALSAALVGGYLDGPTLIEEMRHSADVLAAGLLDVAHPDLAGSYFEKHAPPAASSAASHGGVVKQSAVRRTILPVKKEWQPREAGKKQRRKPRALPGAADNLLARSKGTRVIPVFVLSLAGMDPNLLLEEESQVSITHDAVIVLQTGAKSIPLSFVSEGERRTASAAHPTAAIVAGVAGVMGGLVAPYEKVGIGGQRRQEEWLWASGHHPFGPFSNTSSLSVLQIDTMLRNSIYSRVDTALRGVREALKSIQDFAGEYLTTPLGHEVAHPREGQVAALQWLDELYSDPKRAVHPIPKDIVTRLEANLQDFEEMVVSVSGKLYDHQLKEAHMLATSLLYFTQAFHEYAHTELAEAREQMRCCQVEHKHPRQSGLALLYASILLTGLLVYFVVIYFASGERR